MDTRTEQALEGSIRKWEGIVEGKEVDNGYFNCSLCQEFKDCVDCPIKIKIGKEGCSDTPYAEWEKHQDKKHPENYPCKNLCPTCKILAQKELDFLKSLREKKEFEVGDEVESLEKATDINIGGIYKITNISEDRESIDFLDNAGYPRSRLSKDYKLIERGKPMYKKGDRVKIIKCIWGEKSHEGEIGIIENPNSRCPKDNIAKDTIAVKIRNGGCEALQVELAERDNDTLSTYSQLKQQIEGITGATSLKEVDDIAQKIYDKISNYIEGAGGYFLKIPLRSECGGLSIISFKGQELANFQYHSQCQKLQALKDALMWLLNNSDLAKEKDDKKKKIEELEKKIEDLREEIKDLR